MSEGDRYEPASAHWHRDWGETWVIVLPHQCQQWTIGTPGEVAQLIAELQALLAHPPD